MLEDDDQDFDSADIIIQPPDTVDPLTDEDSAGEDESGVIDNLSGRQLRAQASVKITRRGAVSSEIIKVKCCKSIDLNLDVFIVCIVSHSIFLLYNQINPYYFHFRNLQSLMIYLMIPKKQFLLKEQNYHQLLFKGSG